MLAVAIWLIFGHEFPQTESPKKCTAASEEIILSAINAYFDATGSYPPDDGGQCHTCRKLFEATKKVGASLDILKKLPQDSISSDGHLVDGWDREFGYKCNGSVNGGPVLISAGPDGQFDNKDNIRSDTH